MGKRGVLPKTLQNKCNTWSKRLRIRDWHITCRYATKAEMEKPDNEDFGLPCFDDSTVARLHECSIPEKIALILITREYYDHIGYATSWNLDTLILHELIHIIMKIGKKNSNINSKTNISKSFINFEEFSCDAFAAIIYYQYYNNI